MLEHVGRPGELTVINRSLPSVNDVTSVIVNTF